MIADFIANQPPHPWLAKTKTIDQISDWRSERIYQSQLAIAFYSRMSGSQDPLESLLGLGLIHQNTYETIWFEVDWLEALWGLIQLGFSHIKSEVEASGSEFPFKEPISLFQRVLAEMAQAPLETSIKPYYEVSPKKLRKSLELSKAALKGNATPIQLQNLSRQIKDMPPNSLHWYGLVMWVCHHKATNRRASLKSKLEATRRARDCWVDFMVRKSYGLGSFAWNKGVKVAAKVGGSYSSGS